MDSSKKEKGEKPTQQNQFVSSTNNPSAFKKYASHKPYEGDNSQNPMHANIPQKVIFKIPRPRPITITIPQAQSELGLQPSHATAFLYADHYSASQVS